MRIAMGVEYEGTQYFGFQHQDDVPSIQDCLARAVSTIANHPVEIICAGRTDRGVHAQGQVIHFDTEAIRPDPAWLLGVNTQLPPDISIRWAQTVPDDFHARYKAISRRYQYRLYNSRIRSALYSRFSAWYPTPLDHERMQACAQALVGEHDFSAFRASECQSKSPIKTIECANVFKEGDIITLDIKADAFLHHMVRNIMGTLIRASIEEKDVSWMTNIIKHCDRSKAGFKAEPQGLILIEICYPTYYNIPSLPSRIQHELV